MRSLFTSLRQLAVPAGRGPSIVIGAKIPAELSAYYAPDRVVAVVIYRQSTSVYEWDALVEGSQNVYLARGVTGVTSDTSLPFVAEAHRLSIGETNGGYSDVVYGSKQSSLGGLGGVNVTFTENAFVEARGAFSVTGPSGVLASTVLTVLAGITNVLGPLNIDGRSAPRGYIFNALSQSDSATINTTISTVMALGDVTFPPGRAFRVQLLGQATTSLNDSLLALELWVGTSFRWLYGGAAGPTGPSLFFVETGWTQYVRNPSATAVTRNLNVRGVVSGGTAVWRALPDGVRGVVIEDVGAAADWPGAATV